MILRPRGRFYLSCIAAISCLVLIVLAVQPDRLPTTLQKTLNLLPFTSTYDWQHVRDPIDHLITVAATDHRHFLSSQTSSLEAAARAYRARRGRHPPPGFDAWTQYAIDHNISLIEPMFDQIYHDLEPYWSLPPTLIRGRAATWHQIISIRNRTASMRAIAPETIQWLPLWHGALEEIAHLLPDVDMAFNDLDEPRVIVPWGRVNSSVHIAAKTKHTSLSKTGADFPSYDPLPPIDPEHPPNRQPFVNDRPYWDYIRDACHPESKAHVASFVESDLYEPPDFHTTVYTQHTLQGFVSNATLSRSPCSNPELRYTHGTLFAPAIPSTTTVFFPLFAGCKISGVSNEILVPAAYYFIRDAQFEGSWEDDTHGESERDVTWEDKKSVAYWRGAATGGVHRAENWKHFHRHRLVAMLNASQLAAASDASAGSASSADSVKQVDTDSTWTQSFALPNTTLQPLTHISNLITYTQNHADAAFTHQMCFPQEFSLFTPGTFCEYTSPFYSTASPVPLPDFIQKYRVLPDVDGQSYSGRFRAYMRYSGALIVKGTVFDDWTIVSERLMPWVHYIPMTAEMKEWWGLMNYFLPSTIHRTNSHTSQLGSSGGDMKSRDQMKRASYEEKERLELEHHEAQARKIAEEGRDWAQRVLRKEDMLAYLFRLVLEYARVCADDRDRMGWALDLVGHEEAITS